MWTIDLIPIFSLRAGTEKSFFGEISLFSLHSSKGNVAYGAFEELC